MRFFAPGTEGVMAKIRLEDGKAAAKDHQVVVVVCQRRFANKVQGEPADPGSRNPQHALKVRPPLAGQRPVVPGPLTSAAQPSEPELISSVYAATMSARTALSNLCADGPEADCSVFTDAGEHRTRRGEGD